MQYPFHWYAYVVGGFLWAVLILLIPPESFRNSILSLVSQNAVLSVLPTLIMSYVLGVVADTCLVGFTRPILVKLKLMRPARRPTPDELLTLSRHDNVELNHSQANSYIHMVFLRSIVTPAIVLSILAIVALFGSDWHFTQKLLASAVVTLVVASLIYQFISYRKEYLQWRDSVYDSLHEMSLR